MTNFYYYVIMYFIVFLIKAFKIYFQNPLETFKTNWYEILYCSLDMVIAGSSIVIMVILNHPSVSVVTLTVVSYLLLVLITVFSEVLSKDKLPVFIKAPLNLLLMTGIIVLTYYSLSNYGNDREADEIARQKAILATPKNFLVIIPYIDYSVVNVIGPKKMSDDYYFTIKLPERSTSADSAKLMALNEIYKSSLINVLCPRKSKLKGDSCKILKDRIRVYDIATIPQLKTDILY